jgi:hypothetical protein
MIYFGSSNHKKINWSKKEQNGGQKQDGRQT